MAVSKVIYGGETLVDLTSDTVTADDLAEGVTATAADGTQITGLLPKVEIDSALSSTSTNPVQNKVINAALAGYLPFKNTYISDANSWLTNGYVKTAMVNPVTQNLPSVCTGSDKWGVLFYIAENAGNGTGTQMFFPIDGTYKGRIFTRNLLYKKPSDWTLIPLASDFATVATSGSYNDLSDTPTIPTVPTTVSSFTNDAGYLTEHQSLDGYAKTEDLATVATSGLYSDLSGTPTIPTVPTTVSAFANDAGYLTTHQDISGKADKATTLAGYGITDAKIASGTITLGSNSITPLTSHQSLAGYAKTADLASVATSGSYNDLSDTPTIPDAVTVDTAMSPSSTNPVQNKVVYTAINDMLKGFVLNTMTNAISWRNGSQVGASITGTSYTGNAATATKATQDADGNVISSTYAKTADLATVATSGSYEDLTNKPTIPSAYTLPTASASTLGGIKVGSGLSINTNGVLSNSYSYTLPNATSSVLGGVKIGSNITVSSGTISLTKANVTSALGYTPPTTNTTYSVATTSSNGLMSSTDKSKLDSLATVATSGSYNDLSDTPTIPDTSSFAQTGTANTWTAAQTFATVDYTMNIAKAVTSATPNTSVGYYVLSGAFTLDLTTLVNALGVGQSMVFTCFIVNTTDSDVTLTVTGAAAYIYIGSASDLAIKSTGYMLLNVLLMKASSSCMAILQGMTLSDS